MARGKPREKAGSGIRLSQKRRHPVEDGDLGVGLGEGVGEGVGERVGEDVGVGPGSTLSVTSFVVYLVRSTTVNMKV